MRMVFTISSSGSPKTTLPEVGGKGYSLIRLTQAGLPVPPGCILTTAFFEPWFEQVKGSVAFSALASAPPDAWGTLCEDLKKLCPDLAFTAAQQEALSDLRKALGLQQNNTQFAVRSSSPEEDLESASFAGGYETALGVTLADLDEAVRRCFASSLDERVLVYKQNQGFDVLRPRIAVVVQQQIDSEKAGVGFSLNPLTNDYDEAVINASWGLGESVVSGAVTPDHYLIDKVHQQILEKKPGTKEIAVRLDPGGGTIERGGPSSQELTLSDAELIELTQAICRIERLYGKPVDIEWAYCDGQLYILQARPITTHVPLPPEMLTEPGERRRLYVDGGLSQGLTISGPISPLGLSWMTDVLYADIMGRLLGIEDFTPEGGLVFSAGCRFYMNLSNAMRFGMSPKLMAKNTEMTDALLARILASIDSKQYRARKRPPWLRFRLLLFLPRALWMLRSFLWKPLAALSLPHRTRRAYQRKVEAFETAFTEKLDYSLPLPEFARRYTEIILRDLFLVTIPALVAGLVPPGLAVPKKLKKDGGPVERLGYGLTGNIVVEQGIALFRLARMLTGADFEDVATLAERIERREMPAAFLESWDAFLSRFGSRGPLEMDVASPRYADDPVLALHQMSLMAVDDAGFDPEGAHQRSVAERWRAFEELMGRLGRLRRVLLRRLHTVYDLFGGERDTPKHHAVLLTYALRRRALLEGNRLAEEGRLDTAQDIFNLTFDDIKTAGGDPELDLREIGTERSRFGKTLAAHVREFPQVIDSRGRILRPAPREGKPGELVGMPVSPGCVSGPVKVLRSPHEKPVEKGDVLVAYTTDPGWTPLFVNAAAVVLEVGGILQHGAVIAREYGKPCVAGVDRAVSRLSDDQTVEVDGTAGVIRILAPQVGPRMSG